MAAGRAHRERGAADDRSAARPRRSLRAPFARRSSLGLRLTVLLTLALVPLGLLAFEQTRRLERELDRVRALNFHASLAEIARREGGALARAEGIARSLSSTLPVLAGDDPAACAAAARRVVARAGGELSFAGFLSADGAMRCTSGAEAREVARAAAAEARGGEPRVFVTPAVPAGTDGPPVIALQHPVFDAEGAFAGYVSVALAGGRIALPGAAEGAGLAVALVDAEGALLGTSLAPGRAARALPARFDPARGAERGAFLARDGAGTLRAYTVEPLLEGAAYAVGMRPRTAEGPAERMPAAAIPLLMWLASVGLVLGVLETSLIGHVRDMGRRMRRFGQTRQIPPARGGSEAGSDGESDGESGGPGAGRPLPAELALIEETFAEVAGRLARDEARLLDALHEQEVLMQEVHHRVKNNLQIISSIINLQIRAAEAPETRHALSRIGTRIASLATVHRQLYEAERVGRIRFDTLLREVVASLTDTARPGPPGAPVTGGDGPETGGDGSKDAPADGAAPRLAFDLAPLRLPPNQALPGAMFAVEAVTNALKYATPDRDGRLWIRLALTEDAERGTVTLSVESSGRGPGAADPADDGPPAGLGNRLITGFARQLGGQPQTGWHGEAYLASVTFRPAPDGGGSESGGGARFAPRSRSSSGSGSGSSSDPAPA